MSKKKIITISVVVAILILIGYRWQSSENTPDVPPIQPVERKAATVESIKSIPPFPMKTVSTPTKDTSAGFLPTEMEDPKLFESFQKHLAEMGQCLKLKMLSLDPQSEINLETLSDVMAPDLGRIVGQSTDWSVTDIKTKTGEMRRIYIQYNPNANDPVKSTLKYIALNPNGSQKELELSPEQSKNPTENFLKSLESDGELVGNSVARKINYQGGYELYLVERNGKIYSFELPVNLKVYSCTGADSSETIKCECK